jgi:putative restriction endonuclease
MRYWWVNHKQTFWHEFEGQYVWSPKRKRDGSRNRFYDFLREVVPRDVVFSYADGAVHHPRRRRIVFRSAEGD